MKSATYEHKYSIEDVVDFQRAGLLYEKAKVYQVVHVQSKRFSGVEYVVSHEGHIYRIAEGNIIKGEAE